MMRPISARKPKRHFYILLDGRYVGQSWAVSPEKARTNFWWRAVKNKDVYASRKCDPKDFDVVEE